MPNICSSSLVPCSAVPLGSVVFNVSPTIKFEGSNTAVGSGVGVGIGSGVGVTVG